MYCKWLLLGIEPIGWKESVFYGLGADVSDTCRLAPKAGPDLEEHLTVPSLTSYLKDTCTRVLTPTRPRTEKNNEEKLSYQFFKSEKKSEVTGRYLVKKCADGFLTEVIQVTPYFKVFFGSEIKVQLSKLDCLCSARDSLDIEFRVRG